MTTTAGVAGLSKAYIEWSTTNPNGGNNNHVTITANGTKPEPNIGRAEDNGNSVGISVAPATSARRREATATAWGSPVARATTWRQVTVISTSPRCFAEYRNFVTAGSGDNNSAVVTGDDEDPGIFARVTERSTTSW